MKSICLKSFIMGIVFSLLYFSYKQINFLLLGSYPANFVNVLLIFIFFFLVSFLLDSPQRTYKPGWLKGLLIGLTIIIYYSFFVFATRVNMGMLISENLGFVFNLFSIIFLLIMTLLGFLYPLISFDKAWIKGLFVGLFFSLVLIYFDFSNMMYGMIVPLIHIPISLLLCSFIGAFIGYIYTKLKENQFLQKPYLLGLIIGVLTFGILYLLYLLPKITFVSMSSAVIFVDFLLWYPFRIIFGESALF